MREIKFRAWHTVNKVMIENKNLSVLAKNIKDDNVWKFMQYTGLKDCQGKGQEIYEGDYFQTDKKWFVEWNDDSCRFVLTTGFGYDSNNCVDLTCDEVYYLKIAGNKYENKD